jgi:hypothetical protein
MDSVYFKINVSSNRLSGPFLAGRHVLHGGGAGRCHGRCAAPGEDGVKKDGGVAGQEVEASD